MLSAAKHLKLGACGVTALEMLRCVQLFPSNDDPTSKQIDLVLQHLDRAWRRLPKIAGEIDSWDLLDRAAFVEEWPLEEQRLHRLEEWEAQNLLTPNQQKRLQSLR